MPCTADESIAGLRLPADQVATCEGAVPPTGPRNGAQSRIRSRDPVSEPQGLEGRVVDLLALSLADDRSRCKNEGELEGKPSRWD